MLTLLTVMEIDGSFGDRFDITMTFVLLIFNLRPNLSLEI